MYAVIKTGGKQYVVNEGDTLRVEKLPGEPGTKVELTDVIAVGEGDGLKVGNPTVEGAAVTAEIVSHGRSKKIVVFKKKRRKGYTKKQGHRQDFSEVRIQSIKG